MRDEAELPGLKAALFNLHVAPVHAIVAMAGYMAATNVRKVERGFDDTFTVVSPSMTEGVWPHAVAMLLGDGAGIASSASASGGNAPHQPDP